MVVSSQPGRTRKSCPICVLPSSVLPIQLSTFDLQIALSPSLDALCPKSVHQLLSHQSLPHSFPQRTIVNLCAINLLRTLFISTGVYTSVHRKEQENEPRIH